MRERQPSQTESGPLRTVHLSRHTWLGGKGSGVEIYRILEDEGLEVADERFEERHLLRVRVNE